MVPVVVWTLIAFTAGSLPFSVWVGRFLLRKDITTYGDANPGATNVIRAGGKKIGALALLLDTLKALIPVGLAYYWTGIQGWGIVPIALAPIMGHAFSPFLGFHGGKAVATTLGTWMALTIWEFPTIGGLLLWGFTLLVGANGWAVIFAFVCILPILLLTPPTWHVLGQPLAPDVLVAVWIGNFLILVYKHWGDLSHPPALRRHQRKQTHA